MSRRSAIARAAALLCSATLVAAYVGYRAWGSGGRVAGDAPQAAPAPPDDFMSGSKSDAMFYDEPAPRFIGGSKRAEIIDATDITPTPTPTPAPPQQQDAPTKPH